MKKIPAEEFFSENLCQKMRKYGSRDVMYCEEKGFMSKSYSPNVWALVGQKVLRPIRGNFRKATNLIRRSEGLNGLSPCYPQGLEAL